MKYKVKITNLSFDLEFQPIWEMDPPKPIDPKPETIKLDWMELAQSGSSTLEAGNYHVEDWIPSNNDFILKGKGEVNIYFGSKNYSIWDKKYYQYDFLFLVADESKVLIDGINLYSASEVEEVQPFYMSIFKGEGRNQDLQVKNLSTNMCIGLLYSVSQEVTQIVKAENVKFKGLIWQQLKANKGGGLKSIIRDCDLQQVDPITYFKAEMSFNRDLVTSQVSFNRINNQFNSWGNSCNILYVEGMTFYLPPTSELGHTHSIRPIPNEGDEINLVSTGHFFRTNENSLQVGDEIDVEGFKYTIKVKDRPVGSDFENSGYGIDLNVDPIPYQKGEQVKAKVIKSNGLKLVGKAWIGYMIFKYNKHFQTNLEVDHGLDYMLASNPFGVLSYNHKEITVDWENVNHNGYYRQSSSGVGSSNGYRIVNCSGLSDEFNPGIPIEES